MNTNPRESHGPSETQHITLRGPAELADALPFMLGFHPNDSVVLVALHGEHGRFGGRVRLGIPRSPKEWPSTAEHLAECLVDGCARRGTRPDGIVVFLCQDPEPGETARRTMERLRPFAQRLRTACGELDIPVYEVLCISDGLYFSYCCPDTRCCPPDGTPLALTGTSVMAASAAYAGIQVRGSLREMQARLKPRESPGDDRQRTALNAAAAVIVPKILDGPPGQGREEIRETTLTLAREMLRRFGRPSAAASGSAAPSEGDGLERTPVAGLPRRTGTAESDAADDALITPDEAATLILGLQDRETRDRAAEWMEGPDAKAALRLWRVLARRCVAPYGEHAAAPLTLAGWVAWSTGDEPAARVALGLALEADPEYVFARLLHQACNEGLDPESLRSCLREEREAREAAAAETRHAARRVRSRAARAQARQPVKRSASAGKSSGPAGRRNGPAEKRNGPADSARPGTASSRVLRDPGARRSGQRGTRSGR
ncbi:DUF4192 domain-containing protein [Streptomyces sp. NPDC015346]|uniref:DUF4192 domain-containing protein n=1 Tax=Streptomyces sp. NPDC015346 TaxID=3364954 RepID=UPI0036F58D9B